MRIEWFFIWTNLIESPLPKDALCHVWLKLAQSFWIFKFLKFVIVFLLFVIISPWKRGPFIWTNLNSLHQMMHGAKFGWNCTCGSGEEDFSFSSIIFAISLLFPLGKGQTLYFIKIESSSPKDALCQVWLKLDQWFLRRRFFNFVNVFSVITIS